MSDDIRFKGYAKGAIRTHAELLDIVIEARKDKKAIRLYVVEQSGYFSELFLTSKSKIEASNNIGIWSFNCWTKSAWSSKPYRTTRCLGDLNVVDKDGYQGGHNRHQLFSNRRAALEYSETLKQDAGYLRAVAEHHRRCDAMFRGFYGWRFAS